MEEAFSYGGGKIDRSALATVLVWIGDVPGVRYTSDSVSYPAPAQQLLISGSRFRPLCPIAESANSALHRRFLLSVEHFGLRMLPDVPEQQPWGTAAVLFF